MFIICILLTAFINNGLQGQNLNTRLQELAQLVNDKKFKEAVAFGTGELTRDSLDPQIYYYLGISYSNLRQYHKACLAYEKSNVLLPGNKPILLNLAECYCEIAAASAAEVIIKDLLQEDSADTYTWLQLALVYQRQAKADEAAGIYSRLWSEDSSNIWYPRQIGSILIRNERFREAIPYLESVVDADSNDQGSFLRLGQAYINLKSVEKIPVLDKAIRQDSLQPVLHRYRGGLWLGAGQFKLAETDLITALELGDTTAFTCRHLGISQFQQSKYDQALWAFTQTVKIDSLDTEAWYYLGFCYKWAEDIPKAIECLSHALKIAIPPSTGSIYSGLGLFYNLKRDLKSSMLYYKKALEYNPADAYPLSQLGLLVEQTTRDKELAREYYEQFIREYNGGDQHLIDYVNERIQIINEKLFMEGKVKKK